MVDTLISQASKERNQYCKVIDQNIRLACKQCKGFLDVKDKLQAAEDRLVRGQDGIRQQLAENLLKQNEWYTKLDSNQATILKNQLISLDNQDQSSDLHIKAITKQSEWFINLDASQKELINGQIKIISNQVDLKQGQLNLMLQQEDWYKELDENQRNIKESLTTVLSVQLSVVKNSQVIINQTADIQQKLNQMSLQNKYQAVFQNYQSLIKRFGELNKDSYGGIISDTKSRIFHTTAIHPEVGIERTVMFLHEMVVGSPGTIFPGDSLFQTDTNQYCNEATFKMVQNIMLNSHNMEAFYHATIGYYSTDNEIKKMKENIRDRETHYLDVCGCQTLGLEKTKRADYERLYRLIKQNRSVDKRQSFYDTEQLDLKTRGNLLLLASSNIRFTSNSEINEILRKMTWSDIRFFTTIVATSDKVDEDLLIYSKATSCLEAEPGLFGICCFCHVTFMFLHFCKSYK